MRLCLTVRHANDVEQEFASREPTILIGRDPQAHLQLSDNSGMISWHHARIDLTNGGGRIEDLGSTNGTYVNGRRVAKGQPLPFQENDVIQFGQKGPRLFVRELEVVTHTMPATVLTPMPMPAEAAPAVSHASRNGFPALVPTVPSAAAAAPPGPSPTRLMLMQTQRRFRFFTVAGLGFAACAVVALGVVGVILFWHQQHLATLDEQVAKIREELSDTETNLDALRGKDGEVVANTEHMYERAAGVGGSARPEDIYLRTATSTAWLISSRGSGSGVLIDRDRRLVATAYHVVRGVSEVDVVFPKFYNGRILSNVQQYSSDGGTVGGRDAIRAKVWATRPDLDLAIVELPAGKLPPEILPLPLASGSVPIAATVHSVGGHPHGSTGLWVYANGAVREVGPDTYNFGPEQAVKAWVVSTQVPINEGNSGGPLVNDRCELVGIASSGLPGVNVVTKFIDVRHVQEILKTGPQKPVVPPTTHPGTTTPPPPPVIATGSSRGRVHALLLIDSADPKIGESCVVDCKQMRGLLDAGLPKEQCTVTTLDGDKITTEGIEAYYRSLATKVRPEDTVYCYYSGHGTISANHHFLALVPGGSKKTQFLQRETLTGWMAKGNPRLRVLITDCCSSYSGGSKAAEFGSPPPNVLTPLFLKQRGVVDWTAASPGQYAFGYMFTPSLDDAIVSGKPQRWDTLFEDVKKRTAERYKTIRASQPAGSGMAKQATQTPYSWVPLNEVRPN